MNIGLAQFSEAVEKWQHRLLLQHWRLTVKEELDELGDIDATTLLVSDSRRAVIKLHKRIPVNDLGFVALHEVIHVLLADLQLAENQPNFNSELEKTTEHLSHILAGASNWNS